MEEVKEIPFGAFDSETIGWTYTIPEGFTAKIKDGKIIVEKAESEDEKIRKMLIELAKNCGELNFTTVTREATLAYLEKQKEQKAARWNEEDETYLQDALWCVKQAEKSCKDGDDKGACWSAERWLKSLRPQPYWKPSEKQMKIFNEAIEHYSKYWDSEDIKILCSLYDDLKKL